MTRNILKIPQVGEVALVIERSSHGREVRAYDATVKRITPSGMVVVEFGTGDSKQEARFYEPKWGHDWREHGESYYGYTSRKVFFAEKIGPERQAVEAVLAEQAVLNTLNIALNKLSGIRFHNHPPTLAEIGVLRAKRDQLDIALNSAETWRQAHPSPADLEEQA